jgi:hypothetical protein
MLRSLEQIPHHIHLLNWFVFTPLETFHPPVWQWPIALLVLAGVWLAYRYGWTEGKQ